MEQNELKKSYVTFALMAVNILVFLGLELMGGSENSRVLVRFGALYTPYIRDGEYWRLFTAMFLHIGGLHLISNMFSLFVFGSYMEARLGKVRYLILYLVGGLIGSLLTYGVETIRGEYSITAGASGAIFALLGGLIILALFRRNLVRDLSPLRVIIVVALMLSQGATTTNVSMTGHIGGLIGGMLAAIVLIQGVNGDRHP